MPLKVIELRNRLDAAIKAADEHRNGKPDFGKRREALKKRGDELNTRLDTLADDAQDTVRAEIAAGVAQVEADAAANDEEEAAFDSAAFDAEQERLDGAVKDLERQIAEIENNQEPAPAAATRGNNTIHREDRINMHNYRSAALLTRETRERFMTDEKSQKFINFVRALGQQGRSVDNVGAVIPDTWLDVIRDELPGVSKLIKYVRHRKIKGNARQPMTGGAPEAVWIGATNKLNETTLSFNDVEYDSYALGSYIIIPKIYLASDSVVDFGMEIIDALINAIGVGVDKAIVYGTNTKMPLGVVTRIAQTSDPSDPSINYPWVDIHSTNKITISSDHTGAAFFRQLALAKKALKKKNYPTPHGIVWLMNASTHAAVDAEATYANVLAVGTNNDGTAYMPVLKGAIEELDFIPDDNIVFGYFDLYGLAEREGGEVKSSDIPLFFENAVAYKAVTYADGMPLEPAAFGVIGIGGTSPTTELSFSPDYANMDLNTLTVTAAAHDSTSGKTVLTVSGKKDNSNTLKYKITLERLTPGVTPDTTWTALTSGSTAITAAAGTWITVAELDAKGKIVGAGYVQSVPKA